LSGIDIERVFHSLPGLFIVLRADPDFTIVDVSDAYLCAIGIARDSIVGRPFFDVFAAIRNGHDGLSTNVRASLQRVLATGQADALPAGLYDVELLSRAAAGARGWSALHVPVRSDAGEVTYIIHRVDPDGDHVRASKNVCAADILESITEGIFSVDRDWRFTYVNREGQNILGRSHEDLVGKVMWDEYPGVIGTPFENTYRNAMDARQPGAVTAFYPDHDRWYELRTYPASDGITACFRNVSQQKLAEAEQNRIVNVSDQRRRMYEVALSSTPDLVYVFDLEHRFVYANEALLKMWGKTAAESYGKRLLELGYEPWHAAMHDREIDQVIATRSAIRGEVPFTGTNGRRIYDYIFVPVFGSEGEVVAVAGTTRDITDRQAAEQAIREQAEQLQELDRAKDAFLATLAHELRNPLAPIRHAAEILAALKIDDDRLVWAQQVIHRQVKHMASLLDDLLNVARITQGKLELRKELVVLGSVVETALESARPLLEAKGHRLTVELPTASVALEADPLRLSQILSNLLTNAAKYTDRGGKIDLRAYVEADQLLFSIKDTGIGLPSWALDKIFTMFSQVEGVGSRSEGGLGIGLALVKGLVDLHGGHIEARSEGPGKGSEFIVSLPLAPSVHLPVSEALRDGIAPAGQSRKVLVADDNKDAADALAMMLTMMGHDVVVAHHGLGALRLAAETRPEVAVLDISMPDLSGYEVARRLRSEPWAQRLLLIALTGFGQDDDKRRALESGFDRHLTKPIDTAYLCSIIADPSGVAKTQ